MALPPKKIIIRGGWVQSIEEWTLWNGEPFQTLLVERRPDGKFTSSIGDPEHGGVNRQGSLDEVLVSLHPAIAGYYKRAFEVGRSSLITLITEGFKGYEIDGE